MSLLTRAIVADKYGLRLSMDQLAEAMGMARNSIYNQISAGTFPVPTYLDGGRYCDYRDLADYLDECHKRAKLASK